MARKTQRKNDGVGRETIEVKHDFTADEFKTKAAELTSKMNAAQLKEESIKAQSATAKAELKALKAEINDLAEQLRRGSCMVSVQCLVEFNRRKGTKRYYQVAPGKPEDGKLVEEMAMTEDDFTRLPIDMDGSNSTRQTPAADKEPGEESAPAEPIAEPEPEPGEEPTVG